jgi:hypothetical protein
MASDLEETPAGLTEHDAALLADDTVSLADDAYDAEEDFEDYRSLSGLAVTALIVGVLSVTAFAWRPMLLVPIAGVVLGVLAVVKIRREPEYYTGKSLAVIGIILSLFAGTTAGAMHSILGALEVPEDYEEITFWQLQPRDDPADTAIPQSALELDGRRVFVKGYVFPGTRRTDLKTFVLVPDMKTCCFGGNPKATDMIEVTLADPLRVDFAYQRRGLGGTFHVHRERKAGVESKQVYYELEADYLK